MKTKTLKVYTQSNVETFEKLYEEHYLEVDSNTILRVFILSGDGSHHEKAVFKNWDYYLVED
jgi:hypothetical protein